MAAWEGAPLYQPGFSLRNPPVSLRLYRWRGACTNIPLSFLLLPPPALWPRNSSQYQTPETHRRTRLLSGCVQELEPPSKSSLGQGKRTMKTELLHSK